MDSDIPVFARRLREARQRIGISQYALGVAAGIDEMSASPRVNQYERGKHTPDFTMAQRLAKVLQIPVAYLYSDDDQLAGVIARYGALAEDRRRDLLTWLTAEPDADESIPQEPG